MVELEAGKIRPEARHAAGKKMLKVVNREVRGALQLAGRKGAGRRLWWGGSVVWAWCWYVVGEVVRLRAKGLRTAARDGCESCAMPNIPSRRTLHRRCSA
ncbi:hypothetical protein BU16DRAFT_144307 [Lophium mytilinum]|uniref:Uncharacterized protein n=1 Tax=Lophium mytilinum TaxID=390894 RepID=A0A6A6QFE7_9PEZI|nr:hypothetical protein BU16DRAFT_144307 [Lophium mytilinum]